MISRFDDSGMNYKYIVYLRVPTKCFVRVPGKGGGERLPYQHGTVEQERSIEEAVRRLDRPWERIGTICDGRRL